MKLQALSLAVFSAVVLGACQEAEFALDDDLGPKALSKSQGDMTIIRHGRIATADGRIYCVVTSTGMVECWGNNSSGQFGNGTTVSSTKPVAVIGLSNVVAITVSHSHACALTGGGTVDCWGSNFVGQLGNGTTTASLLPVEVAGLSGVVSLSAGINTTCAVTSDGTVHCWGYGAFGELGNGTTTIANPLPVTVTGITNAVEVSMGDHHACARLVTGEVQCWGLNDSGQLGNGTKTSSSIPVAVQELGSAKAVVSGSLSSCALSGLGSIFCWGSNSSGQLGNGTTVDSTTPVAVQAVASAQGVSLHEHTACALMADGTARCWGDGTLGQLGNGTHNVSSSVPAQVSGLTNAVAISAGDSVCALTTTDGVMCWGAINYANGGRQVAYTPVAIQGFGGYAGRAISAGVGFACAIKGAAACWGRNDVGQLGDGTIVNRPSPASIANSFDAVAVSAGKRSACAVGGDGKAWCWGDNSHGELGNGTTVSSLEPVQVSTESGATGLVDIQVGSGSACALSLAGTIWCWGDNSAGQLGHAGPSSSTPASIEPRGRWAALSVGMAHACAISLDGTPQCWGQNSSGQLGIGTRTSTANPVPVSGLSKAVSIQAGFRSTCALLPDGTVQCWGDNAQGQLGNGTTTNSLTPVSVLVAEGQPLTGVKALSSGALSNATCALLANGGVKCWGRLPDAVHLWPADVTGSANVTSVATGMSYICLLTASGEPWCWGSNLYGQLGDGTTEDRVDPVAVQLPSWQQNVAAVFARNGHTVTWDDTLVIIITDSLAAQSFRLTDYVARQRQVRPVIVLSETWEVRSDGVIASGGWAEGVDLSATPSQETSNARADAIRAWLQAHRCAYGIKYALLVGNPSPVGGDVPMKGIYHLKHAEDQWASDHSVWGFVAALCAEPKEATGADQCTRWIDQHDPARIMATDYYYSNLTYDFPRDADGDVVDITNINYHYADIHVGRVPIYDSVVSNLDAILSKFIAYSTSTDLEWRKSALLAFGDQGASGDNVPLAETARSQLLEPNGYSSFRIYNPYSPPGCSEPSCQITGDLSPLSPTKVGSVWAGKAWPGCQGSLCASPKSNYGIVFWAAHGGATGSVGVIDVANGPDYYKYLDDTHPAFTVQLSCSTSEPFVANNVGTVLLQRGAIATLGGSRITWSYYDFTRPYQSSAGASDITYGYLHELVQNQRPAGAALSAARVHLAFVMDEIPASNWGRRLGVSAQYVVFNLYGDPTIGIGASHGASEADVGASLPTYPMNRVYDPTRHLQGCGCLKSTGLVTTLKPRTNIKDYLFCM